MQLTDCHPVVVDIFKREAIYAVLASIGVPIEDRPRWVVARRVVEPVLVASGEDAARAMLEDFGMPEDVLLLEIPEIEDIRTVDLAGERHVACTILGQHYTAYVPPEAADRYEEWGHAPS